MKDLIKRIFELTGVTYSQLYSPDRTAKIAYARMLFCHEMRFKHGWTCEKIGRKIGRKRGIISRLSNKKIEQTIIEKLRSETYER